MPRKDRSGVSGGDGVMARFRGGGEEDGRYRREKAKHVTTAMTTNEGKTLEESP